MKKFLYIPLFLFLFSNSLNVYSQNQEKKSWTIDKIDNNKMIDFNKNKLECTAEIFKTSNQELIALVSNASQVFVQIDMAIINMPVIFRDTAENKLDLHERPLLFNYNNQKSSSPELQFAYLNNSELIEGIIRKNGESILCSKVNNCQKTNADLTLRLTSVNGNRSYIFSGPVQVVDQCGKDKKYSVFYSTPWWENIFGNILGH